MISMRCQCGEMMEAPGSMAGEQIKCPKCGKLSLVRLDPAEAYASRTVRALRMITFAVFVALPFLGVAAGREPNSIDPSPWLALLSWYGFIAITKFWFMK